MIARIVEGRGGIFTVQNENGEEYILRAGNKFRYQGITPLVGDMVHYTPGESEQHGWIDEILPRKNTLTRPPVANIEKLGIVVAEYPQPDWLLVDKILLNAFLQEISPVLIINKIDLGRTALESAKNMYSKTGIPILYVSAITGEGIDELKKELKSFVSCFAGQSGVGKSTLLSKLLGIELETGELSRKTMRGKQTTRHTQLFIRDEVMLFDTPGFSLLNVPEGIEPHELALLYPEFNKYLGQCKFSPCYHDTEPECAVSMALERDELNLDRVERYRLLLAEVRHMWQNRYN